jgi:N-formylglutamate deformylase
VQLEISQRTYMDEDSFAYDASKASVLQSVIRNLLLATLSS